MKGVLYAVRATSNDTSKNSKYATDVFRALKIAESPPVSVTGPTLAHKTKICVEVSGNSTTQEKGLKESFPAINTASNPTSLCAWGSFKQGAVKVSAFKTCRALIVAFRDGKKDRLHSFVAGHFMGYTGSENIALFSKVPPEEMKIRVGTLLEKNKKGAKHSCFLIGASGPKCPVNGAALYKEFELAAKLLNLPEDTLIFVFELKSGGFNPQYSVEGGGYLGVTGRGRLIIGNV